MTMVLRFHDGGRTRREVLEGEEVTIGRSEECQITVTDETISRHHARFLLEDGRWWVEDLGSRNGLRVGDRAFERHLLEDGLPIFLGNLEIITEIPDKSHESVLTGDELPGQGIARSIGIDDLRRRLESQSGDPSSIIASGGTSLTGSPLAGLGLALDLFKGAAETLLGETRVEQVSESALDLALRSLPIDRGFISLIDPDSGELLPQALRSRTPQAPGRPMQLSSTIASLVLREKRSVLIGNIAEDSMLKAAESIIQMRIRSVMCAPLLAGDSAIGILYVDCLETARELDAVHLDILSVLALMASNAIEQCRLRTSIEEERRLRQDLSCRLSPNVVEKVILGEAELGSRESEISVLFADLVGFTPLSEELAATEVTALLNDLFDQLTDEVFTEDGTLDKYIGDALIAFFGAPDEQQDHAARAVRTALAMQKRLKNFVVHRPDGPQLEMRIGINSGTAVVGDIGSTLRRDYTVIGDVVNTASRLESQVAKPGEVVIGPMTAEAIGDQFLLTPIEEVSLKGKKQRVKPFRVEGMSR